MLFRLTLRKLSLLHLHQRNLTRICKVASILTKSTLHLTLGKYGNSYLFLFTLPFRFTFAYSMKTYEPSKIGCSSLSDTKEAGVQQKVRNGFFPLLRKYKHNYSQSFFVHSAFTVLYKI